jgi:hypothetical protein
MYWKFLDSSMNTLYHSDKRNIRLHMARDSQILAGSPRHAREFLTEYEAQEGAAELRAHGGHS